MVSFCNVCTTLALSPLTLRYFEFVPVRFPRTTGCYPKLEFALIKQHIIILLLTACE
jgi:hypothetical protein